MATTRSLSHGSWRRAALLVALLALAPATPLAAQDAAGSGGAGGAGDAPADTAPAAPARALDSRDLALRLGELAAAHPDVARVEEIGVSLSGQPIHALVLAARDTDPAEAAGLLMVGNLDGRRVADSVALLSTAERLLDGAEGELSERLGGHVLVIVPRLNPDGADALLGARGPVREQAGNGYLFDLDRDARVAEDGPADLDGDGAILWMRVPDPEGEWVIDEHDPRAMRKARTSRGERGTHRLLQEGRDTDGDGAENEDPGDGVLLDSNFPHGWKDGTPTTGLYPLSEPETRGLADYVLAHPGLQAVLVLGTDDTLVSLPKEAKAPSRGFRGFREAPTGVFEDDVGTLGELQRRFKKLTKDNKHEVKGGGPSDGSFLLWAYAQAGRWPLALKLWAPPEDLPKPKKADDKPDGAEADGEVKEGADAAGDADAVSADAPKADAEAASEATASDEAADAAQDAPLGGRGGRGGRGGAGAGAGGGGDGDAAAGDGKAASDDEDKPTSDKESPVPAAVLAWLDEERGGEGFVAWKEFDHDQLGTVEIGGLMPGVLVNPPLETAAGFAKALAPFALEVLACLPTLAFEEPKVQAGAPGVYTIEVALLNTGVLPTASELGAGADLVQPVRVDLSLPDGVARLNGPPMPLVDRLEGGGGRRTFRWVVSGPPGSTLTLRAAARGLGSVERKVELP